MKIPATHFSVATCPSPDRKSIIPNTSNKTAKIEVITCTVVPFSIINKIPKAIATMEAINFSVFLTLYLLFCNAFRILSNPQSEQRFYNAGCKAPDRFSFVFVDVSPDAFKR